MLTLDPRDIAEAWHVPVAKGEQSATRIHNC
jgi:hypothetical protein